jgi:carboxymethylenebutenolidase
MGTFIELTSTDAHAFAAYRAEPTGKPRGGLVVLQEIFGVNSHIRAVADGFAADGYLVLAPALFDRIERNVELGYTGEDWTRARETRGKVNPEDALRDIAATVTALRTAGAEKIGVVGYCWGGRLSWLSAASLEGLACAVPYYGNILDSGALEPKCLVMLHYGELDGMIPIDEMRRIAALHPAHTLITYPADHGFNCDARSVYHAESARIARERTLGFLRQHVG